MADPRWRLGSEADPGWRLGFEVDPRWRLGFEADPRWCLDLESGPTWTELLGGSPSTAVRLESRESVSTKNVEPPIRPTQSVSHGPNNYVSSRVTSPLEGVSFSRLNDQSPPI
jgi:hypothetical protein